ncbi:sugar ABC transporter ATPase [Burkholderia multivorans]|nr:sugar ABC transporter ATPase [Burkholderia multivorans]
MNGLRTSAAMLCVGCSIVCGVAHGAGGEDASPCRAANAAPPGMQLMLPDRPGVSTNAETTVRSFSTQGCAGAVLKGERGTATVDGDKVELKQGAVYVNGISYGTVAPAQTVEYDVARGTRTLRVDGEVRTPAR